MTKFVTIEKNKTLKAHLIALIRKSNPGFSVPESAVTIGVKTPLEGIVDGVNRYSVPFDIASTNKSYTLNYDPAPELFGADGDRNFVRNSGETVAAWLTRLRAARNFPSWMGITAEVTEFRSDVIRIYITHNILYINYEAFCYTGSTFIESSFRMTVGSYSSVPYKASAATVKYGAGQVGYNVMANVESGWSPAQYENYGNHNAIAALGLKAVTFGSKEQPTLAIYLDPTSQRVGLSPTITITNQALGISLVIRAFGTFDIVRNSLSAITFKFYPKAGDFTYEKLLALGAYTVGTNLIITMTP